MDEGDASETVKGRRASFCRAVSGAGALLVRLAAGAMARRELVEEEESDEPRVSATRRLSLCLGPGAACTELTKAWERLSRKSGPKQESRGRVLLVGSSAALSAAERRRALTI